MEPVTRISGRALAFPFGNVDTDQIVPARFLYRKRREGFADTLFHDLRADPEGRPLADFPLNKPESAGDAILVALDNFGCGSSREHAVWALCDAGYRCVIAISFGDIFRNNAIENGLLPVALAAAAVDQVLALLQSAPEKSLLVDLPEQCVDLPDGRRFTFEIDSAAKENLLLGRGRIGETLTLSGEIDRFEQAYRERFPWSP